MLISFVVPCFNSEKYMRKCIDSLLVDSAEIILVNDGSTDNTGKICDEYKEKYNNVVVIHKENGGHGSGVNAGLRVAKGNYFKVVDSDDWLDRDALNKVLKILAKNDIDMFLANFVYEHVHTNSEKVMSFGHSLPKDEIFTWRDIHKLKLTQYILMHNVIYRTSLLIECGLELPNHTFYVDNIFVYYPLQHVSKLYYADVNLYRYYIGRDDQSVNEKRMISLVDNQVLVTKTMINVEINPEEKSLRKYMIKYLGMMMSISSIFLMLDDSQSALNKKKELWEYLERNKYHRDVRYKTLAFFTTFNNRFFRRFVFSIYKTAKRIFKFN